MQTNRVLRSFGVAAAAAGLLILGHRGAHAQGAGPVNVLSEIETKGQEPCAQPIERAQRFFTVWQRYRDTKDSLTRAGVEASRERLRWEADASQRQYWKVGAKERDVISVPTGELSLNQVTRYGSRPLDADIQVVYQHDWTVSGEFGWGSSAQPRVLAITEITLKEECAATLRAINEISLGAQGAISGNSGGSWPQMADHESIILARDIQGNQHKLTVDAHATAVPSTSRSRTRGESETTSWSVNGNVSVSSDGPSASAGSSYGESQTSSRSVTSGRSIPGVTSQTYQDSYGHTAEKTQTITCGGHAELSRAAEVSGDFYTKSLASDGGVSSSANHYAINTVDITVVGEPCSNRETGAAIHRTGEGTQVRSVERDGVIFTPSSAAAVRDDSAHEDVLSGRARSSRPVGSLYLPTDALPPFLTLVPASHAADALENVQPGTIPVLVSEEAARTADGETFVRVGLIRESNALEPARETNVRVNPGLNRITFDGPFRILHPPTDERIELEGGYVNFRDGTSTSLRGDFEVVPMPGEELEVEETSAGTRYQSYRPTGSGRHLTGEVRLPAGEGNAVEFVRSHRTPSAERETEVVSTSTAEGRDEEQTTGTPSIAELAGSQWQVFAPGRVYSDEETQISLRGPQEFSGQVVEVTTRDDTVRVEPDRSGGSMVDWAALADATEVVQATIRVLDSDGNARAEQTTLVEPEQVPPIENAPRLHRDSLSRFVQPNSIVRIPGEGFGEQTRVRLGDHQLEVLSRSRREVRCYVDSMEVGQQAELSVENREGRSEPYRMHVFRDTLIAQKPPRIAEGESVTFTHRYEGAPAGATVVYRYSQEVVELQTDPAAERKAPGLAIVSPDEGAGTVTLTVTGREGTPQGTPFRLRWKWFTETADEIVQSLSGQ